MEPRSSLNDADLWVSPGPAGKETAAQSHWPELITQDFPSGLVVENPPSDAGLAGVIGKQDPTCRGAAEQADGQTLPADPLGT